MLTILIITVGFTRCKTTWFDETAYASAAVHWAEAHNPASPIYPGFGPRLNLFPLHAIALGEFYRAFGVGLTQTRIFGLLCVGMLLAGFYVALRGVEVGHHVAELGTILLACDRSLVWQLRSGRPDLFAILLLTLSAAAFASALRARRPPTTLILAGLGAALACLGPLAHPYSTPGAGVLLLGCFAAGCCRRGQTRLMFSAGAGIGALSVLFAYACYATQHAAAFQAVYADHAAFLSEEPGKHAGFARSLWAELRYRWAPTLGLEPVRLGLLALGAGILLRLRSRPGIVALSWFAVPALAHTLFLHKETHYQMAYCSVPIAGVIAIALHNVTTQEFPNRIRGLSLRATTVAIVLGLSLAAIYPLVAVMQWDARSHTQLVRTLRPLLPSGSVVAVDPSAYFACVENGCTTYYAELRHRHFVHDAPARQAYRKGLRQDYNVDTVILKHGTPLPKAFGSDDGTVRRIATVGRARQQVPFARDPAYHFDVWRIGLP